MEQSLAVDAPSTTRARFVLHRTLSAPASSFADDVRTGLTATPKFLLPHYFYDALGSALFNAICELPEYYVTRAETEILTAHAAEIAGAFGATGRLVELGSGSARKSRLLIEALLQRQEELAAWHARFGGLMKAGGVLLVAAGAALILFVLMQLAG